MNVKKARGLVALAVFVVVGVGLAVHTGSGTPSSLGYRWISTICPLGALEAVFGSWTAVVRLLVTLAVVLVVCLVVGKAFCAWVCPIPHVQNLFKGKKRKQAEAHERNQAAHRALERYQEAGKPDAPAARKPLVDGRHVVLGGALASAAVFGFPVFCLVCPVGLTVGEFVLLWRFVQYNEMTWALLLFPAIVIVEVVVFRRWCHVLCPISALLSLISTANRTLRPTADRATCLRDTHGQACQACAAACPEHIDPHSNLGDRPLSECIRCGACKVSCPVAAITFPLIDSATKGKKEKREQATRSERNPQEAQIAPNAQKEQ